MKFSELKSLFAKAYLDNIKLTFTGAYNMAIECIENLPDDGVKQIFSYGRPCYPEIWIEESDSVPDSAKVIFAEYGNKEKNVYFNVKNAWRSFSANGFEIYQIILNLIDDIVIFKISPYTNIYFMEDVFSDALVSKDASEGIIIKTGFFNKHQHYS